MSIRIVEPSEDMGVDVILRGRVSRRAFCTLAGAAVLACAGLAGCAAGGTDSADDAAAQGEAGAEAESGPGDDGTTDAASEADAAAGTDPVSLSTFAFDALCNVTAYGVDEDAVRAVLALCPVYEDLFSAHKEGTDIWRLNEAAGEPVEVDPDTADLLARSLELAQASGGAFDPTVGTVSLLWDFEQGVKPDDDVIAEALTHVGWEKLAVSGTTAQLSDPQTKVDLGGIAKGWIAHRLADALGEAGCTSALVNLDTSSILALGSKPGGAPWRLGLRDPLDSSRALCAVVEIADECITSSGLYEQEFELDGTWYWHILDPTTGYPVQTDVAGDTLICADATEGDATSTILFVKGSAEGSAWLEENHPDMAALFICQDGEQVFANGFENHGYAPVEQSEG